jgi:acyl-ACP thioesterase
MSPDIRNYEALTYDLDAYQHVNDMKYSYKYPEREDFQ